MTVIELIEQYSGPILQEASKSIARAHLEHYEKAGKKIVEERFKKLLEHTLRCMKEKRLIYIEDYAKGLAQERFSAGYDLREVQVAINVLEEAVWKVIVKNMPPDQLAEALGLTATILGSAKDTLAQTYVSLASKTKSASLDLKKMFL